MSEIKDCLPSFRDLVTDESETSVHGCRMVTITASVWDIPEKAPVLKACSQGSSVQRWGFEEVIRSGGFRSHRRNNPQEVHNLTGYGT